MSFEERRTLFLPEICQEVVVFIKPLSSDRITHKLLPVPLLQLHMVYTRLIIVIVTLVTLYMVMGSVIIIS